MLQITLKNLPPETQQGVLKEWTAMYQKSGTTYNQYLASLQQRHAAQRQVGRPCGMLATLSDHTLGAMVVIPIEDLRRQGD